jgi:hypothetical protein
MAVIFRNRVYGITDQYATQNTYFQLTGPVGLPTGLSSGQAYWRIDGAGTGFGLSNVASGNSIYYSMSTGTDWEVGKGRLYISDFRVYTQRASYTISDAYSDGVLGNDGYIHFVPYNATVGQKISDAGVVSTYSLIYTTAGAYVGGVLGDDGHVYFVPHNARVGQKVDFNGTVSTYSLVYTTAGAYAGGVLDPFQQDHIHFVPHNANRGQRVGQGTDYGLVSTYSLPYTTAGAYWGGFQGPFAANFVNYNANRGMKVEANTDPETTTSAPPVITTYTLPYTAAGAYRGAVLDYLGNAHYVPYNANRGTYNQDGVVENIVTTYSLAYTTTGAYSGGVLDDLGRPQILPDGSEDSGPSIHFVPHNARVGQKIFQQSTFDSTFSGMVTTYALPYTTTGAYEGGVIEVFSKNIYFVPRNANQIQKLSYNTITRDTVYSSSNNNNPVDFDFTPSIYEGPYVVYPNAVAVGGVPSGDNNEIGPDLSGWRAFRGLLEQGVLGGNVFNNRGVGGIVSTYSLGYTLTNSYRGGVLAPNGDIHFVPYLANRGQKISSSGVVSTYSLVYTSDAYLGGVLAPNGDIHFIPHSARVGQKININGVVSTYSLLYTTLTSYGGGVLAPNGDVHFIPYSAERGQKVSAAGVVSTYSLVYTGPAVYGGGVLAPNGDIHFVPLQGNRGQKISAAGVVSTYSLIYTNSGGSYWSGVVAPNGDIHFIPANAVVGQKISINGTVSTYSLVYTATLAHAGGVLAPNGDIHFVPWWGNRGQKISAAGVVSTYPLIHTNATGSHFGGILRPNGDIHFVPTNAVGQMISTLPSTPLPMNACLSPFLNKL